MVLPQTLLKSGAADIPAGYRAMRLTVAMRERPW